MKNTNAEKRNFAMVQVRVSAREKALIAQAAEAANKSITTWAREHLESAANRELSAAQTGGASEPLPAEGSNPWWPEHRKAGTA
jgi:hypothetical protein